MAMACRRGPSLALLLVALGSGMAALGCASGEAPDSPPESTEPAPPPIPKLSEVESGTNERLQAVSALADGVVWASGVGGVWVRTLDGGESWQQGGVVGAPDLQFRDVHAISSESAYLLSAGEGPASRVYRTTDGGRSWDLQITAAQEKSFWDCFDFWDAERGLLFGDSVNGQLEVLRTLDGGSSWRRLQSLPAAVEGEGGFAASGSCVETWGQGRGAFVTGAGSVARRFSTDDWGESWAVAELPLPAGEGKGAMAVVHFDSQEGETFLVVGGDVGDRESFHDAVAVSMDGGATWQSTPRPGFSGPIYGAAATDLGAVSAVVAVGPMGASLTVDRGATWQELSSNNYWSVSFSPEGVGWMVGPEGRITKLEFAQ